MFEVVIFKLNGGVVVSKSLCVSCMTKKGVSSVVVMCDGKLEMKSVTRIKDTEVLTSSYLCLIDTFITALRLVRKYVDENSNVEKVVFEVNNSTFIKWVYNSFSKEQYQDLFSEALELLNEIPIQYALTYSKKPLATMYLSEVENEVKLSGLLDEDE